MGAEGTGIATVIAQTLQFIILFTVFLNKENHSLFNTRYARWNGKSFKDCLTYGGPNAFGHLFEITGWAVLQNFLARFNLDYMTVGTIAQSCFIFLTFAGDGLQKALISIASNMIGAGVGGRIRQVLRSALKFQLILSVLIFIPLVGFPEVIGKIFIADLEISPLRQDVIIALRGVWIFLLCDAGVWILASILTAGGDTRFIMVTNALTSWSCVTVPAYIWLHYFPSEPSTLWKWLIPLYGAINLGIFINRYKAKHWLKKLA
jgi:MATE family multidrug resistance protein